jgi:protein-tyrosine phosphatase
VTRLTSALAFGPVVTPADTARLRRFGVTAVLSLQESGADVRADAVERMRRACAPDIDFRHVGVRDYDPDDLIRKLPAVLAALAELHAGGRVTYVHCCEGVNRAPSAALAYLVLNEGVELDDALAPWRQWRDRTRRSSSGFVDRIRDQ